MLGLDLDDGPEPVNDREYLQRLYRMVKELRAAMVTLNVVVERQNGRVRRLEDWQARIVGALTVLAAVTTLALGSLAAPLVVKLLTK